MNLTYEQINDFIAAWKRDFGETLSPEISELEVNRLLEFFADMTEDRGAPNDRGQDLGEGDGLKAAWKRTMSHRKV